MPTTGFSYPCDLVSLALQGAGGGLSTTSSGSSHIGVDVALAGLSFQVFTLVCFISLCIDYTIRYRRGTDAFSQRAKITRQFKIFAGTLAFAILCILIRCVYRIDELSNGYNGPLISDQGLFIGLEGVMIIVAAFALNVCLEYGVRALQQTGGDASAEKIESRDAENQMFER